LLQTNTNTSIQTWPFSPSPPLFPPPHPSLLNVLRAALPLFPSPAPPTPARGSPANRGAEPGRRVEAGAPAALPPPDAGAHLLSPLLARVSAGSTREGSGAVVEQGRREASPAVELGGRPLLLARVSMAGGGARGPTRGISGGGSQGLPAEASLVAVPRACRQPTPALAPDPPPWPVEEGRGGSPALPTTASCAVAGSSRRTSAARARLHHGSMAPLLLLQWWRSRALPSNPPRKEMGTAADVLLHGGTVAAEQLPGSSSSSWRRREGAGMPNA
jgi:hypothetical protein